MEITGNVSRTFQDHVLFLMLFGKITESRQFMISVISRVWNRLYFFDEGGPKGRQKDEGVWGVGAPHPLIGASAMAAACPKRRLTRDWPGHGQARPGNMFFGSSD